MDTLRTPDFGIHTPYITNKYGHEKEFDEKDMEDMESIREQLGPMKKGVTISCNIPVCGHQEQKNIYRCLSCFAQQKPETYPTFEVNLLINSPEPTGDNTYSWEATKQEIERFKKEHPEITVNVAYFRFQGEFDIGLIRSHLNDARMLDVSDPKKHLFASYDADMMDMPGEYMMRLPRLFQKPEYQLLAGRFRDSDDMLCYFPAHRIAGVLRPLLGEKKRKSSGGNMAFRLSAYEEVGGYQKTHGIAGEDGALGWAIRKNLGGIRQGNSAVTITSSARRKIVTLLETDGQKPEHGFWHSKGSDGSVVKNAFSAGERYREAEYIEDLTLLKEITTDEVAWQRFLKDLTREIKDALGSFLDNQKKWHTVGKREIFKTHATNIRHGIMQILGIEQGKEKDAQNTYTPKKWNQAMKILGIEKWHIKVDGGKASGKITITDLQILQADGLKEKLKLFIADKEKLK